MALGSVAYNFLFRRSSTFYLTVFVGAVVFERAVDQLADGLFNHLNKGKQWKDIKHKYEISQE